MVVEEVHELKIIIKTAVGAMLGICTGGLILPETVRRGILKSRLEKERKWEENSRQGNRTGKIMTWKLWVVRKVDPEWAVATKEIAAETGLDDRSLAKTITIL